MSRVGAFPGSFNPPTVAHLAAIEAAIDQRGLDRVDLVVSRVALAKEAVTRPRLNHRLAVLASLVAGDDRLGLVVSDRQLIADLAEGYDVVIMGADKWHQIHELRFYTDEADRDSALARLPEVAVVPRPPHDHPTELALDVDAAHHRVSSTAARAGDRAAMCEAARAFDLATGAWTDPDRYEAWLAGRPGSA